MSAAHTYVVTPEGSREPYRVTLRAVSDGWRADVERGQASWSFGLVHGPAEGVAWVDDRPVRWRWDAASGRLVLGGLEHVLRIESEAAHRVAALGRAVRTAARVEEIRAPMPGLVLSVEVQEAQRVEAGQGIIVIEAMKMENEIAAPAAGVVREIRVRAGEAVERGAPLCRIEPPGHASA